MIRTVEWTNCSIEDFTGPGPVIEVKDAYQTYCATIPAGVAPEALVEEFISGYDYNDTGTEEALRAELSWSVYDDGGDRWVFRD